MHLTIHSPNPSNPPILDLHGVGFPTNFVVVSPVIDFGAVSIASEGEKLEIYYWFTGLWCVPSMSRPVICCRAARGGGYKGETPFTTERGFPDQCGSSVIPSNRRSPGPTSVLMLPSPRSSKGQRSWTLLLTLFVIPDRHTEIT